MAVWNDDRNEVYLTADEEAELLALQCECDTLDPALCQCYDPECDGAGCQCDCHDLVRN